MAEREEETLGVDLVARRSNSKQRTLYNGADFAGPTGWGNGGGVYESKSNGEEVENGSGSVVEVKEDEGVNGEKFNGVETEGSDLGRDSEGAFHGGNEGSETPNELSRSEHQVVSYLFPMKYSSDHIVENFSIPKSSYPETEQKYPGTREDESTSIVSPSVAETLNVDHSVVVNGYSNGTTQPDNSSVLENHHEDIAEFDVERVIENQDTHDLFCPNCNSCITKRVILRRRKRKIREISGGADIVSSEVVQNPFPPEHEIIQEPVDGSTLSNNEGDNGPDLFRCLSCFSIFFPTGKGFKFFTFRDKGSKETVQDDQQLSTSDAPATVPAVTDREVEPGKGFKFFTLRHKGSKEVVQDNPQLSTSDPPAGGSIVTDREVETGTVQEQHLEEVSVQEQSPLTSLPESLPEEGGKPTFGEQENSIAVAIDADADADTISQLPKVDSLALPIEQPLPPKSEAHGGNKLPDVSISTEPAYGINDVTEGKQKGLHILIHRNEGPAIPSTLDPHKDVTGIEKLDSGKQVVISVSEEPNQTVVSMTLPTETSPETEPLLQPGTSAAAVTSPAPAVAATGEGPQFDIIKSIVYGGLLESIASLSVVTSAAGADTKTLNILALGAANIFGGLFVLAHNLRIMKNETNEHYEEVLGRPGHFKLHSAVAVISYILFGLIPPVIYGFTFRESDNRDYKLTSVASASLLCIIILALGKAYTRRPPKSYMKTLFYYISLWVMVCGVSYVAGDLFDMLLKKLGLSELSSSLALPVGQARPVKTPPWASY